MSFPKVSVITVNWNNFKDTAECLESLRKSTYPNFEVVVVDNCSGDDSPETIRGWLDRNDACRKVILVESESNSGFSGGNNTGIRFLKAKDYLLLNSDTLVWPNAIRIMMETETRAMVPSPTGTAPWSKPQASQQLLGPRAYPNTTWNRSPVS